ncbi:MAG: hypothetical protein QF805_02635 [Pirellulaceae bacterium]|jgi:hypothetical protein|nr:hypothetical protein [Pirellulaceae bacterium]
MQLPGVDTLYAPPQPGVEQKTRNFQYDYVADALSRYVLAELLRSGLRQKSGSEVRLTIELKQGNSGEGILANPTTYWPSCYVVDFARSPAQKIAADD